MKAYQDYVLSAGTVGTLRTRRIILEFRLSSAKSGENWGWCYMDEIRLVPLAFQEP
jgi:hypothetical protein